jgi:hypothetical protein
MSRHPANGEGGVEMMCHGDILFIGHDLAKLTVVSAMLRSLGSGYIGIFDDDVRNTEYPPGSLGAVILCNSVLKLNRKLIAPSLHAVRPEGIDLLNGK